MLLARHEALDALGKVGWGLAGLATTVLNSFDTIFVLSLTFSKTVADTNGTFVLRDAFVCSSHHSFRKFDNDSALLLHRIGKFSRVDLGLGKRRVKSSNC